MTKGKKPKKKEQKIYVFLYEKMSRSANSLIEEKHSYRDKKAHYYDLLELNYYEPDVFNQLKDLLEVFYV